VLTVGRPDVADASATARAAITAPLTAQATVNIRYK
jgi:hypothetical protein